MAESVIHGLNLKRTMTGMVHKFRNPLNETETKGPVHPKLQDADSVIDNENQNNINPHPVVHLNSKAEMAAALPAPAMDEYLPPNPYPHKPALNSNTPVQLESELIPFPDTEIPSSLRPFLPKNTKVPVSSGDNRATQHLNKELTSMYLKLLFLCFLLYLVFKAFFKVRRAWRRGGGGNGDGGIRGKEMEKIRLLEEGEGEFDCARMDEGVFAQINKSKRG